MIFYVLIVLAAIFGISQLFQTINGFAKLIIWGQIIAIALSLLPFPSIELTGHVLFILLLMVAMFYGILNQEFPEFKRFFIIGIAFSVFITDIFIINKLPGAKILSGCLLFPILSFLFILFFKLKQYKNEIGFLTIIVTDALIKFCIVAMGSVS